MLLRRLRIQIQHDRHWVTFSKEGADDQSSGFRLDDAFDASDVIAAACATGWVVQRDGDCWVLDGADCDALGEQVNEMLFYFLRSGEPRPELVRLRERIKPFWQDESRSRSPLSLWATAYLDLVVRERIADEARQAEDLWERPVLQLEVDVHLQKCVEELAGRYARIADAAQELTGMRRMAPSRRTLSRHQPVSKDAS